MDVSDVEQWTLDLYDHTLFWDKWIKTPIKSSGGLFSMMDIHIYHNKATNKTSDLFNIQEKFS